MKRRKEQTIYNMVNRSIRSTSRAYDIPLQKAAYLYLQASLRLAEKSWDPGCECEDDFDPYLDCYGPMGPLDPRC